MDLDVVRSVALELSGLDRRVGMWLSALAGLTVGVIAFSMLYPIRFPGMDFQAFWCAGSVFLQHANPYLNQPLHACEAAHSPAFFAAYPNVTIPVPLPPYAIAILAPISLIPFTAARALWWFVLAVAAFAMGRGISQVTGMPPITSVAVSFLAVLGPAIFPGALAPIPVAITVFAALAVKRGQWNRGAILLGLAMIEPHMVLPACAAAFAFVPQMRLRLTAVAVTAGALTIAAVGPHVALSYFTTMLPTHALAEVNNLAQYSLTAVLYRLGVAPELAVRIGSVQYAALVIGGIFIAGRLYRNTQDRSWLILVPAAFAVVGGAFIHLDQVAMVVPLACLIVRARPSKLATAVLVMLAVPGEILINWLPFAIPGALVCGWLVAQTKAHWKVVVVSSIAVVAVAAGMLALLITGTHFTAPAIRVADPGPQASASVAWGEFTSFAAVRPRIWWTEKLLTMLPLLTLLAITLGEAFRPKRSTQLPGGARRAGVLSRAPS